MMSGNEIQLRCASSKEWDSSLVTNKHQQKLGQHWDWETCTGGPVKSFFFAQKTRWIIHPCLFVQISISVAQISFSAG